MFQPQKPINPFMCFHPPPARSQHGQTKSQVQIKAYCHMKEATKVLILTKIVLEYISYHFVPICCYDDSIQL